MGRECSTNGGEEECYTRHNKSNYPSPEGTWTHRRGHTPKIEITNGSTAVSSAIVETPEDDECWSKHVVCIRQ
jgi:hypothetical protein